MRTYTHARVPRALVINVRNKCDAMFFYFFAIRDILILTVSLTSVSARSPLYLWRKKFASHISDKIDRRDELKLRENAQDYHYTMNIP